MTAFLLLVAATVGVLLAGAEVARWSERRVAQSFREAGVQYGPRLIYGPTDPTAADESVAAVLGWTDPFTITRRQIAALPTVETA